MSITLKNIEKRYGADPVLQGLSIVFNPGEKIALIGENGAGKTTILKLCAGLEEPTGGSVFLDDDHVTTCSSPRISPRIF